MTEQEYRAKEDDLKKRITAQRWRVADARAALHHEAGILANLETELAWLPARNPIEYPPEQTDEKVTSEGQEARPPRLDGTTQPD